MSSVCPKITGTPWACFPSSVVSGSPLYPAVFRLSLMSLLLLLGGLEGGGSCFITALHLTSALCQLMHLPGNSKIFCTTTTTTKTPAHAFTVGSTEAPYPRWQVRGREALLDASLLLLQESESSAESAVLPRRVPPPPEEDHKSDQQPAEAELEVAQRVNGEDENKRLGHVQPGAGQRGGGGHRGVVGGVPR